MWQTAGCLRIIVSKETKQGGFIDENGNEAVPMIYQNAICDFYKGRTYCIKDKAAYLVDNQGKVLKVLQGYHYVNPIQPVGKYAMLFKTEKIFDIYDYNGNLCYQDYTDWNFNSITALRGCCHFQPINVALLGNCHVKMSK